MGRHLRRLTVDRIADDRTSHTVRAAAAACFHLNFLPTAGSLQKIGAAFAGSGLAAEFAD